MTFNMFQNGTLAYLNAKTCAFNRVAMIAGLSTAIGVCFDLPAGMDFSLLPGDLDGKTPPPASTPNPQFEVGADFAGTSLWRYQFHVDFGTPASSTLTGPTVIPVMPWIFPCGNTAGSCVTQPGTGQWLDTLGERLMYRVAYRNFVSRESVVITHSVDAGSRTGVRWYEIRNPNGTTPTVYQQSTYAPDSDHRWMSSAAMDKAGNILIGYSRSSSTTFPSIYYTGRLRSEPRGYLESEALIIGGTGSQVGHDRWEDYSAMTVDPVDDCTFWYIQEYIDAPSGDFIWKTRIANAKFPNCN